ncbi:uncharacterized protein LOC132179512 [Corylus avellana]|uniref:uncharacterized protein LOC132179501 n=1 Tax=Corylus avellana TaxID=13451 RepID=UPI001E213649|nr:uncharacterized protein LOC132179501 [Corylus avellana]XP_059448231.1 uncharacterized protein LOC132179512 [Corylus avellana]
MDPCPFVRILVGNLALKYSIASSKASQCFCKIKLKNFPTQYATVPLILQESQTHSSHDRALAACFTLDKTHIDNYKLAGNGDNPVLQIAVYAGRRGAACGLINGGKFLGTVEVEVDLIAVETRASNIHKGWVAVGGSSRKVSSAAQLHLSVRAEPDPRFVFQFDGEPECSPQVFQVHRDVRQAVFSCKFGFKNANDRSSLSGPSMSERSTARSCLMGSHFRKDREIGKQRKGWQITVHDLAGSTVAMASMVTPFVPSQGSDSVSQSNPGAWLILRPGDGAWNPWGRLEAWRECGGSDSVGYRFHLLSSSDATATLAAGAISSKNGGKFSIDMTSTVGTTTPVHTPKSSCDFGSGSFSLSSKPSSRSGSGSGSELGYGPLPPQADAGFVMSSTVERAGRCSQLEVEVGAQHVTCSEDAAVFVALAAAMDLSMDACGLFSKELREELRQ